MKSRIALACLALSLIACGGPAGPERPKPLSHHFDEMYIAQIDMSKKAAMLKAQNEYHRARAAHMKASADLDEVKTLLSVAENERKQALLEEQSASEQMKAAEASADLNRINTAKAKLRAAELGRRAADEKVAALKAHRKYLVKHELYTEWNMYAQEARFELAKAQLAKQNSIQPKGFEYAAYESQAKTRSEKTQRSKYIADQEKEKAKAAKAKWQARKKEADRARGVPTGSSTASQATETTP